MHTSAVEPWLESLMEKIQTDPESGDISNQKLRHKGTSDLPFRWYAEVEEARSGWSNLETVCRGEYDAFMQWKAKGGNEQRLALFLKLFGPGSGGNIDRGSNHHQDVVDLAGDSWPTLYQRRKGGANIPKVSIPVANTLPGCHAVKPKPITESVEQLEEDIHDLYLDLLCLSPSFHPDEMGEQDLGTMPSLEGLASNPRNVEVPRSFKDFMFLRYLTAGLIAGGGEDQEPPETTRAWSFDCGREDVI